MARDNLMPTFIGKAESKSWREKFNPYPLKVKGSHPKVFTIESRYRTERSLPESPEDDMDTKRLWTSLR
jgi:hypothetical protein